MAKDKKWTQAKDDLLAQTTSNATQAQKVTKMALQATKDKTKIEALQKEKKELEELKSTLVANLKEKDKNLAQSKASLEARNSKECSPTHSTSRKPNKDPQAKGK